MNNDWTRNSSLKQFFFVGLKRMERGRSFKKYESNQQRAIIEIYVINNILNCGQRHDREHVLRSGMNNLRQLKKDVIKNRTLSFAMTGRNALSFYWANQANWRASHCEFVIYPMVAMTWIEIYETNHILNCGQRHQIEHDLRSNEQPKRRLKKNLLIATCYLHPTEKNMFTFKH